MRHLENVPLTPSSLNMGCCNVRTCGSIAANACCSGRRPAPASSSRDQVERCGPTTSTAIRGGLIARINLTMPKGLGRPLTLDLCHCVGCYTICHPYNRHMGCSSSASCPRLHSHQRIVRRDTGEELPWQALIRLSQPEHPAETYPLKPTEPHRKHPQVTADASANSH
jgi:hypothetical protein